jgi:hypothetical protein
MTFAELPLLTALPPEERPAVVGPASTDRADGISRRRLLGLAASATAVGMAMRTLDIFGGRSPAYASCGTTGLLLLQTCGVALDHYGPTQCTNGCPRDAYWDNNNFCASPTVFGSRHRTCGETYSYGGYTYDCQIRENDCATNTGSGYDGWLWQGVDEGGTCDCGLTSTGTQMRRHFGCNDGWGKRIGVDASYYKSICQTTKCGAG